MRTPIRVVKVGGSLFELVDLEDRLHRWLAEQSPAHHVFTAGGGALLDQVRMWNDCNPIDDATAHWMCVDLMTVTARWLHAKLPEIAFVEDYQQLCRRVQVQDYTIFAPATWMRESEPELPGQKLPANWDVTSDAIAARLAICLNADELVLLKSASPPPDAGIDNLSAEGYVDLMMPKLAGELPPMRLVDLQQENFTRIV